MINSIFNNKSLILKFVFVSFLISATAVILGVWGTKLILNSREHKVENFFIPDAIRTIELIQMKTQMPLEEVVSYYNNPKVNGEFNNLPMTITVIKKQNASTPLPPVKKSFLEISGGQSHFNMFKDQIYNYDGENFLVFHFNPPPPRNGEGPPPFPFILPLFLTFIIILVVITTSAFLIFFIFKRQARKAAEVLRALKLGNLKARFPIGRLDETTELMLEFNQMAAEIEKLVGDLRDFDNLRRKLLQELAHDLRTPLASMKSLLESLLYQNDKMTKEQREENLILTIKEVEYFQHLVEDLLFLSGVHDLNYRGNFVSVDVVDVIQHEVSVLGEMNKNIKISFIYEQFYYIKADDHLFQRLIKNALSNAIENASTGVIVKLVEDHQVIIVQIINDGNKLNAEDEITFGKKRATRRLNDNFSGKISIGLGAVIMAKICEIHSASMRIRNNGEDANAGVTLELKFSVSKED